MMALGCERFVGFGDHCQRCSMKWLMHEKGPARVRMSISDYVKAKPAPVLTVIEGGKGDEEGDVWSAWMNGEVNQ